MPEFGSLPPMLQWMLTLLGGAGIGAFAWRLAVRGGRAEVEDALEKKFLTIAKHEETRRDLTAVGEKMNGVHRVAEMALEQADTALAKIAEVEMRLNNQWERITERMAETAKTLERVTEKVEAMAIEQARLEGEREARHRVSK